MQLKIVSYNADSTINDGTNFTSRFVVGGGILPTSTNHRDVPRPAFAPIATYTDILPGIWPLEITMLGNGYTQFDTLKKLFDVADQSERVLIVSDSQNSNKQWYVYCQVNAYPRRENKLVFIDLKVNNVVYYSNTLNSDNWSVTASGQTHNITIGGNQPARPIFTITPTSAKTAGFGYKRLVLCYNTITKSWPRWGFEITGGWNTSTIVADTTRSVQINQGGGIDAVVTTIPYDTEVGTLPSSGMAYVGTEQISYTGKTGTNLTGCTRGINGTSAATHADNAVIAASKVQADGDDVRVYVDGVETNRWFGTGANAFNQAATLVYINLSLSPKQEMTLNTALSNVGAVATITFKATNANDLALSKMPKVGFVLIDSELFFYAAKDSKNRKLTGCTRSAKSTSAASHSSGATIRWIEHILEINYGDSAMLAPETDDTVKPCFDLTSTNTNLIYNTQFASADKKRTSGWYGHILSSVGKLSQLYYTTLGLVDPADPVTAMGMQILNWQRGTSWMGEVAKIAWQLYHPGGMTAVTSNGKKWRATADWPALAALQKSNDGLNWVTVWNTATPGSSGGSYSTWTQNAASLAGTYNYIRFIFSGSLGTTATNEADMEVLGVTPTATGVPVFTLGAEQTNNYALAATITNNISGEWILITFTLKLNAAIQVDCENKTVTYQDDGSNALAAITLSTTRFDWLNLAPGTATLQWDDVGSLGITVQTQWRDRNS